MAKEEKLSFWQRAKERIQTIVPLDPNSKKSRSMSMETQRENALSWIEKRREELPRNESIAEEKQLPKALLSDAKFAASYSKRTRDETVKDVLPYETRRDTEYVARMTSSYNFYNQAMKYDDESLQIPTRDHDRHFTKEDKLYSVSRLREMGVKEATDYICKRSRFVTKNYFDALSEEVLTNKDFLLAVDKAGISLHTLPDYVRENDKLMKECIEESPFFFEVASKRIHADQESFEASMQAQSKIQWDSEATHKKIDHLERQATRTYNIASPELRANKDNLITANEESGNRIHIEHVPDSLRSNKAVIEEMLTKREDGLRFATHELRRDKAFVTEMADKYAIDVPRQDLVNDHKLALSLSKTESVQLNNLPESLQNDKQFVETMVRLNGAQLRFASEEMRNDRDIVMAAISSPVQQDVERIDSDEWDGRHAFAFAPEHFRDDFEIAHLAVTQPTELDSSNLKDCSQRLRDDLTIVHAAVEHNGLALEFASERLSDDKALAMVAVKDNAEAIKYVSEDLKNDFDLARVVISEDPTLSRHLGEDLRKKMIGALSRDDFEDYRHQFDEGNRGEAYTIIAKGLEPAFIAEEHIKSQEELQAYAVQLEENKIDRILNSDRLDNKTDIESWLSHFKIEESVVNDDLTVDVYGPVDLSNKFTGRKFEVDYYQGDQLNHGEVSEKLSSIPFQFGKVDGDFDISNNRFDEDVSSDYMKQLTSLKGCPTEVTGNFNISHNSIDSLEHSPKIVRGDFDFTDTNVSSLQHAPQYVKGKAMTDSSDESLQTELAVYNEKNAITRMVRDSLNAPTPAVQPKPKQRNTHKI